MALATCVQGHLSPGFVPENLRPEQETPDPDDDPTREWREWSKAETRRKKKAKDD